MKKNIIALIAAFIAVTLSATAGSVWKSADAESPILIKYEGTDTAPRIRVSGLALVLEESANTASNSFTIGTGTNVATLLKLINSAQGYNHTAAAPVYPWKAIRWAALSTDNLTNLLVTATNTAVTVGAWDSTVKWDTSAALHYDVALSPLIGNSIAPLGVVVRSIFGDATGTGNATVRVYEDDTVKFQRVFPVSTNSYGLNATNVFKEVATEGNIPASGVEFPGGVKIGQGKVGFVRVSLSGTATTGGIGAATE